MDMEWQLQRGLYLNTARVIVMSRRMAMSGARNL